MNRVIHMILVLILILQTVFTSLGFGIIASAEGNKQDVISNVNIKELREGNVEFKVDWSIENKTVNPEDTILFTIPTSYHIEKEQKGELMMENLEIGSYSINMNGEGIIEFNDKVVETPQAKGTFTYFGVTKQKANNGKQKIQDDALLKNPNHEMVDEENEDVLEDLEENKLDRTLEKEDKSTTGSANISEDTEGDNGQEKNKTENREQKVENDIVEKQQQKNANILADSGKEIGFNLSISDVKDINGDVFSEENLLDPDGEFQLRMEWNLKDNHSYVSGDREEFKLPVGINITENISLELKDESGKVVATAIITTDKKVELTFTEFVENHSNVQGWLQIIAKLDKENIVVEDGEAVIDPIGEEGDLRIPIYQADQDKTIEKKGTPNKNYNADEINWEVMINKNRTTLTNAHLKDLLPNGTKYKEGSLKVTKLKVDLNGNVLGDVEDVDITGETVEDGILLVPLGDIKDAYRIEYVTTVTDEEEKQFINNITLSDDKLEDISATAKVIINRGEAIKKKVTKEYDPKTGIIEWEIEFNYNEKNLNNVTLQDAWTPVGKLDLVKDSVTFTEVLIDENGNASETGNIGLPKDAQIVPGVDGFEVTGISTDKAYKVTYQTKVKDRVLEPMDVANTAGFGSESVSSGSHIDQYYGAKSAGTIDYKHKTIDWKIEINHDEYPMEGISVTDTLGDGLLLKEDSLKVMVDGKVYEEFTLTGVNPFTITFPTNFTTNKKMIITYQTSYEADKVPDFKPKNEAMIRWTPEDGDREITKDVKASTQLNKQTQDSSWKNGSYNPTSKEITWTIYTNYRENQINDLILKDSPQENQRIMEDSLIVTEIDIAEDGKITDGKVIEGVSNIDTDANTLEVNLGATNKAYKIVYRTSLNGLTDMKKNYTNQAEVFDGKSSMSKLTAKVGVIEGNKYGSKKGYQDGKQIHWSIDVNLAQEKIANLELIDTLDGNQEYLNDTIKVYHAQVDSKGNTTKGQELHSNEVDLNVEDQQFTVSWNNTVERAFIVEYSTLFFAGHNESVGNVYEINGDGIKDENNDASGTSNVIIKQLGVGGGSGEAGYLVIDKVDVTYGEEEKGLAGAEFELVDPQTDKVLKSGITDEKGQIDFGRLPFGTYQLNEKVIPDGYVTQQETQEIVIDKAYEQGEDKQSFTYRVENYQPILAIELLKTDIDKRELPKAEFSLFDSNGKKIATGTTNKEGKILFGNLKEAGTYYIKETKAPNGYVMDDTEYEVVLGDKEHKPVKLSVENHPRGVVILTKVDKDTGDTLEGVQFALQKVNDDGSFITIANFTTDEAGQIITPNTLEAGNYQFVEIKSLEGYKTNEIPVTFTIDTSSTKDQTYTIENEQKKGSIQLIKKDAATDMVLKGATFNLLDVEGKVMRENLVTDNQGELRIDGLLLGSYQLVETKAPDGYKLDETPIDFTIKEDNQVVEKIMPNKKIMDITVEKVWNNGLDDIKPVTVRLLPTEQMLELNEDNGWKAIFTDIEVYNDVGEKIDYQIEELPIEGYNSEVTGNSLDGFVVTNTMATSVSGTKTWLDDDSAERPDTITIKLLANGEEVATTDVTAADDWNYSFADLDKYDRNDDEISYTVKEVPIDGYKTMIDGYDLINLRTGIISVSGEKIWLDENAKDRPESITVNLTRTTNGVIDESFLKTKTVAPNEQGDWNYSFTDLAEFDEYGVAYKYDVSEIAVEGYKTSINGFDITNTRIGETEVIGTKNWVNDIKENRPDAIRVNLFANGEKVRSINVTAETDWSYEFNKLPAYDDKGIAIVYTVTEDAVKGYHTSIDGFDITNSWLEEDEVTVEPEVSGMSKKGKFASELSNVKEEKEVDVLVTDNQVDKQELSEDELPNTATNLFNYLMIGMIMIVIGITVMMYRRKME